MGKVGHKIGPLINGSNMPQEIQKELMPHASLFPRLYELSQIQYVPLRPIVSTTRALIYKLAKYLTGLLQHFLGKCEYHVKNNVQGNCG